MKRASDIDYKKATLSSLGMKQERKLFREKTDFEKTAENLRLIEECNIHYNSLDDFRTRRKRARDYYRGRQWDDVINDPDNPGYTVSEEDYIKRQGKVPLKQNQIRQLVKNFIGQYLSNPTRSVIVARAREDAKATEMLTIALDACKTINKIDQLDAREIEEFAISGAPFQKITYDYWPERRIDDGYIENVNPARMFFNADMKDVRGHDIRLIGEIVDTTIESIISQFAKTKADEDFLRDLYATQQQMYYNNETGLSSDSVDNLTFLVPSDPTTCRYFEIWQQRIERKMKVHDPVEATYEISDATPDEIAKENRMRMQLGIAQGMEEDEIPLLEFDYTYHPTWYVKCLTPNGYCLYEGESPFEHGSHPYAFNLYPLLDGEVWGIVEDIIDQQRYINRLIILQDFIMSSSAKGVLLVPKDVIPDDTSPDDFSQKWTEFNSTIFYEPKPHMQVPMQISANSTNIGIKELLGLQLQLIQDISGIHPSIQGKESKSGTPASLYAQEAQNATINSVDYMNAFSAFKQMRDMKLLKTIVQYYDEPRYLAVTGREYSDTAKMYDPDLVRNLDFDIVIAQGTDTPVYRNMIEETLFKLLEAQAIDIEQYLAETSHPFADRLLDAVKRKREMMMQGQMGGMEQIPGGMPQGADMQDMESIGANPAAMQTALQALRGQRMPMN